MLTCKSKIEIIDQIKLETRFTTLLTNYNMNNVWCKIKQT